MAGVAAIVAGAPPHQLVRFYDGATELCADVARYIADGLDAGEPVLVIASEDHRVAMVASLASLGHDVAREDARGRLALLDVAETIASFWLDGGLVRGRFLDTIDGALARLSGGRLDCRVRVYSEMVDTLCRGGRRSAANEIEQLWAQLASQRSLSLLCACIADNDRMRALERELADRDLVEAALRATLARETAARQEAEHNLRLSELFVGLLGHDLRNPLGTIAIGASHLARSAESERVTTTAASIAASAERMNRMVEQLVDLTRLRANNAPVLARMRLDLVDVWRKVAVELAGGIEIAASGDMTGHWDRVRIARVATTIVDNALAHRTPGTPVAIALDGNDPEWVTARVHNEGALAPEVVPVLFEPFRATVLRGHLTRGLGLGLYLAREIVDAHGGTIGATTGAGTTLTVRLPRG